LVAMLLVAETVIEGDVVLTAATDAPLEDATAIAASSTKLADTAAVLFAETENAPKVVRFVSTTRELVAENVTAPRLTP